MVVVQARLLLLMVELARLLVELAGVVDGLLVVVAEAAAVAAFVVSCEVSSQRVIGVVVG